MRPTLPLLFFFFIPSVYAQQSVDIVIQTGHAASVEHIAWSKDGRYIASAGYDGNVKLWDARLGMEIFSWFPVGTSASHVVFSNDSHYLMVTGNGENVLFDITNGKKVCTLYSNDDSDPGSGTSMAVFSNDNKYVFADRGSKEHSSIIRWDLAEMLNPSAYWPDRDLYTDSEGKPEISELSTVKYFEGHLGTITDLQISGDGSYIASCSEDSTIRLWDAATGNALKVIKSPYGVAAIRISPDNKIYSIDESMADVNGLRTWNTATGIQLNFQQLRAGVRVMAISADGKKLALGSYLKEIFIYDASRKKLVDTLKGHESYLNAVCFNDDGTLVLSCSNDKTIKTWDLSRRMMIRDMKSQISPIDELAYNKRHNIISSLSTNDGTNRVVTWETGNGIGVKNGRHGFPKIRMNNPFFMDSSGAAILASEDSGIVIRETFTGKLKSKIHSPSASSALMTDDGNTVVVHDSKDGNFYRYTTPGFQPTLFATHPAGKDAHVYTMHLSNDGKGFAAGDIGADINIWNGITGEYVKNLNYLDQDSSRRKAGEYGEDDFDVSNAWIYEIKFHPDRNLIAAACRFPDPVVKGSLIIIWDVFAGKMVHWVNAHVYPIQSINWSPDGKYLITGSNDKMVKVWEYENLKEAEPIHQYNHEFTATHSSFTGDLQWIVSAGIDGNIIIKDAASYKTLANLISLDTSDFVAVTPEQYYAASKDGVKLISFRQGMKIMPASQLDLRYNRPDKVLEALGSKDTAIIRSYKKAYEKRMKKLGIDTTSFSDVFSRPEAIIVGRDTIKYNRSNTSLPVKISANAQSLTLDRFNIWVNDVPVYGQRGLNLRYRRKSVWDTTVIIKLSEGDNRIEVSVTDVNGTESYRQPLFVRHLTAKPVEKKLHFIGIGINRFNDSRYNLSWSVKDIRDMAAKFSAKFKNAIIDTLFDENVTRDNIIALKKKLTGLDVNDKVIVSFSGHGVFSKDFDYYLSTYPIDFENPSLNGLSYEDLEWLVDSIAPRQKLLLIDACHSGEVDRDDLTRENLDSLPDGIKGVTLGVPKNKKVGMENSFELMQNLFVNVTKGTGTTIISAAGGTQFALERGDLRNGVFTYSILETFGKNRNLNVSTLKKIVGNRVKELTNGMQVPTSRNETSNHDWLVW